MKHPKQEYKPRAAISVAGRTEQRPADLDQNNVQNLERLSR